MRRGKRQSRRKWLLWLLFSLICFRGLRQFAFLYHFHYTQSPRPKDKYGPDIFYGVSKNLTSTEKSPSHPNFTVDFPLCLVHVGKAGGSSVSCGLGLMYANCEGMPRELLPNAHYFHLRRNTCPKETTKTYLVTLRNPITRLQSWFDFEKGIVVYRKNKKQEAKIRRQRGRLFSECYTSFEDLASKGLSPLNSLEIQASKVIEMNCQERAWAAVTGARAFSYHEWYNYEHYWLGLQAHRTNSAVTTLKVLRAEFFQKDWSKISSEESFRQVNRGNNNQTKHLTPLAIQNLCRALCSEIQFYKKILIEADNLTPEEVQESIQLVAAYCPLEMSLSEQSCSDIPEFPPLKVSKQQYEQEIKKRFYLAPSWSTASRKDA